MDETGFWRVVDEACRPVGDEPEAWDERLTEVLVNLPPGEIVAWGRRFGELTEAAYSWDLWGAAYLINGGASDDGFYYFRSWLVGMGREVYEAALVDPDGLADIIEPGFEYEAEIYGAARRAWAEATGEGVDSFPDERVLSSLEPAGERWDFDDEDENRRRLPQLAALEYDDDKEE